MSTFLPIAVVFIGAAITLGYIYFGVGLDDIV